MVAKLSVVILMLTAIRIVTVFVAIRGLTDQNQEIFLFLYNLAMSVSLLSDFGIRNVLYARISKGDNEAIGPALQYRAIMGMVAALVFIVLAGAAANTWAVPLLAILVFAIFAANTQPADAYLQVLRGVRKNGTEVLIRCFESALLLGLILTSTAMGASLGVILVVWVVSGLVRVAVSHKVASRIITLPYPDVPSIRQTIATFRKYAVSGIGQFLLTVLSRMPILMAPLLFSDTGISGIAIVIMVSQMIQVLSTNGSTFLLARTVIPISMPTRRVTVVSALQICAAIALSVTAFFGFWVAEPAIAYLSGIDVATLGAARICALSCGAIYLIDCCRLFLSAHEKFVTQAVISASGILIFTFAQFLGSSESVAFVSLTYLVAVTLSALMFLSACAWIASRR